MRVSLLISVIFLCAFSFSQENPNPHKHNKNAKAQSDVSAANPKQESPQSTPVSSPPSQNSANSEQKQNQQAANDRVYRVDVVSEPTSGWTKAYVLITAAIGFAGLITIAILWRQTNIAQKSAEAALLSARAVMSTERARVVADIEWPRRIYTQGPDSYSLWLDLICVNIGNTPARITEKRIGIFRGEEPFPRNPPIDKTEIIWAGVQPLTTKDVMHDVEAKHPGRLEPATIEHPTLVVIFGSVKYQDVFGDDHTATFGYRLNVERTRLIQLIDYPEWNKTD